MAGTPPRPRRNTRPRDALGRPLPYGAEGVDEQPPDAGRTAGESLAEASRLLHDGRPFHAHEVLEDAWKSQPDAEREFWRGLAQLAVGMTHAARGNAVGAARLLERGARNLAPFVARAPHGVDVVAVIRWSERAVTEVAGESPIVLGPPPLLPDRPAGAGVSRR